MSPPRRGARSNNYEPLRAEVRGFGAQSALGLAAMSLYREQNLSYAGHHFNSWLSPDEGRNWIRGRPTGRCS